MPYCTVGADHGPVACASTHSIQSSGDRLISRAPLADEVGGNPTVRLTGRLTGRRVVEVNRHISAGLLAELLQQFDQLNLVVNRVQR